MKSYVTTAALLSLLLTAGCADRGSNTGGAEDAKATPAAAEPTAAPAAEAPPPSTADARATTGTRPAPRAPARPSARPSSTPPGANLDRREPAASAAAPARRAVEWREVTIPKGAVLPLELETALSSETAQIEMPVRARVRDGIVVNGFTAIPAGAIIAGEVTQVERAGKVKGRSRIAFTFTRVLGDNLGGDLRTNPLVYVGEASKGEDATKIGAGAVGGAIVGGILGGGEGAAKGAAIGSAAGTGVVLATRGKDVKLASGADIAATLAEPLTIRVPVR